MEIKSKSHNKLPLLLVGIGFGVFIGAVTLLLFDRLRVSSISSLWEKTRESFSPQDSLVVGQPAPDFSLKDLEGDQVNLEDYRGQVVVVNFWATWCGPCKLEMPIIQDYHSKYYPDLVVLGVDFQETQGVVDEFVKTFGLTYKILMDPTGEASSLFQVYMLPNSFIIDREGIIRYHHIGTLNQNQFETYLAGIGIGEKE